MLTVILFVAFMTILATTLLYVTGMNFQIKQTDYQIKKSFYTGETALEEIRAGLSAIVSEAAIEAYDDFMMEYLTVPGEMRRQKYNELFVDKLWEKLEAKVGAADAWDETLATYITNDKAKLYWANATEAMPHLNSATALSKDTEKGVVKIKELKLQFTDDKGLTTIITTDLELRVPEFVWPELNSSLQVLGTDAEGNTITKAEAGEKHKTDVTRCVIYTNWKKE